MAEIMELDSPVFADISEPGSPPYKTWYPTERDWDAYKDIIVDFYIKLGIPKTIKEMQLQYGFSATLDAYKKHIHTKWKASRKYNNEDDMAAMALIAEQRRQKGQDTVFVLRGRCIDNAEIQRYWRRKRMTLADACASRGNFCYPDGLQCFDPPSPTGQLDPPADFTSSEKIFWNVRKLSSYYQDIDCCPQDKFLSPKEYRPLIGRFESTMKNLPLTLTDWQPLEPAFEATSVLVNHSEWILLVKMYELIQHYGYSQQSLIQIQKFMQYVLKASHHTNENMYVAVKGLVESQPSMLVSLIDPLMRVYLDSLSKLLGPLHWAVMAIAMYLATFVRDMTALKTIVGSAENLTEESSRSLTDLRLLTWSHRKLDNKPKARHYALEMLRYSNCRDDDIHDVAEGLFSAAWASWGKQLPSEHHPLVLNDLAENTMKFLAASDRRRNGTTSLRANKALSYLSQWGVYFDIGAVSELSLEDLVCELRKVSLRWEEIGPFVIDGRLP